ncbi:polysaccharide biosynthesis tyrosine autokinase [Maribacter sp. BPC-D8]|uniref:GumC family protein n=1 Tax=Maribacter sp. BPC-D8 TaxID=3053613 RepID=UPI002B48C780|nr:polysaccharide biosynthesis tyrosine autokinase [Maribacter sp. BPC-D8]WRI31726.1 polysaccharide biosynthesis tyrosine autokinase [Maribacter sp. BPC-D8]
MKNAPVELEFDSENKELTFKNLLKRYINFWPWFLVSFILCLSLAFLYLRYANVIYYSFAKIKITDETKELNVSADALSMLGSNSKINIDNETEVLKSFRILSQVVNELNLDVLYFKKGHLKNNRSSEPAFSIIKDISEDSLKRPVLFNIHIDTDEIEVTNDDDFKRHISFSNLDSALVGLPFRIKLSSGLNYEDFENTTYRVELHSKKETVLSLARDLQVARTSKDSDIIELALKGQNPELSEAILNTVIAKFNQDGILDRQQISRRTIDFIDERFLYLSTELDSIEGGKQDFKQENNLSYIEADAEVSLDRKSETENNVANLETQISLSALLKRSVINQGAFELLPVDVGLENSGLNNIVSRYNDLVLQRNKLKENVGEQHPSLMTISAQLDNAKVNVIKTLDIYDTQLRTSLKQLNLEQSRVNSVFARLPEKEKKLRSIERQQSIKENLFLLLLQKREEAAINLAVTEPSIKVVDYGLTNSIPVSPNKIILLGVSGLLGLFLPFAFLYVRFAIDSKIRNRQDIKYVLPNIPFLVEIPHFKVEKLFNGINDRSPLAESYRILATNINYLLPREKNISSNVIYVTSAVSGEGKSLLSYNLSVAYASVNKKVLLVGADLRNPELHNYLGMNINSVGLTDYLLDAKMNWKDYIHSGVQKTTNHHVLLSGSIPPNAPQLLSSDAFADFITDAKKVFDIIIVDTAPIIPVTDTLLISNFADVTLFVTRAGFTEKEILQEAVELNRNGKLKNMAFVLNDVKFDLRKNYNYNYSGTSKN